ncbi:ANTAR domain-containing protein [Actinacidiphila acidipaludis]|uniref:ANTAR domain-containing protein n=1 Tax=Actinacidiphila acidipaludis TaxID=2873382 RepID=A0ABS7QAF4_9ACTN|nr:ANTAR domain-containing protein [Streptomyces acidipaludis]MBY8879709.1 ANTAR domain-containing protein [Streptomyces acidipaludis]
MHGHIVRLPAGAGWLWLLRAEQILDRPSLAPEGWQLPEPSDDCSGVVMDLSPTLLLSAAVAGLVVDYAAGLETRGVPMWLAGASPTVEGVLRRVDAAGLLGPDRRLRLVPSAEVAVAEVTSRAAGDATASPDAKAIEPPRPVSEREVRDLRRRARGWPVIAQAQGLVQGRYGVSSQDALALLKETSKRHNIKLRSLAAAATSVTAPQPSAHEWFPLRARRPAPPLPFLLGGPSAAKANPTEVTEALLRTALETARSDMGNVQLVDPTTGDLWIAAQRGHTVDFLDFFDNVPTGGPAGTGSASSVGPPPGSASRLAAQRRLPVTVLDVTTDPAFDADARAAMLESGCRACHSVPVMAPGDQLLGVVSVHYRRRQSIDRVLSGGRARALQVSAEQAGAWLYWHRRTIVLDALEDLHDRARGQLGASL